MNHCILRAADHRRMPWKNGRGETLEIAVHPQGAGLEDFGWRVSMAGVDEDGAFSVFPGIDRSLAVLTGAGVELHVQGQAPHLLAPGAAPLAFAADVPTSARLVSGPVTDLNVMTRRGAFSHRLTTGGAGDRVPDWLLLLATRPVELPVADTALTLEPLDVLMCEGAQAGLPVPPAPGLWRIEIFRG